MWLYVFWDGVRSVHGEWNPLTLSGSTLFCHVAFHADSTLALARTVFLYTVYTRGREGEKAKAIGSGSGSSGGGGSSSSSSSSGHKRASSAARTSPSARKTE